MSAAKARTLARRAASARERGELEAARRAIEAALALKPEPGFRELRADILSDLGFVVEAIEDLDAVMKSSGRSALLLARRAQFHLQRRNYVEARADLDAALALSPRDASLLARRADLFAMTGRLKEAQRDLDAAAAAAPGDEALRLTRLRVLVERGARAEAEAEIAALRRKGSEAAVLEARFCAACLDFKLRRPGLGEGPFKALMAELPKDHPVSMKARFYWLASRAVDPDFRARQRMTTTTHKPPKLFLCGLGIFPPYTASMDVLHAVSRCDVIFNNVAGPEVRALLSELCEDIRPATYQAWQDEPKWADAIFAELEKGKDVAFVTRGHPLVFGGLAVELLRRCRGTGTAHETFGAVSSIDHLLAVTGKGLGDDFGGIQVLDRPALEKARSLNTQLPLLACFYGGLQTRAEVAAFRKSLCRFYRASQPAYMFGPKYDTAPVPLRLSELEKRFAEIHPSLMLYVPPIAGN